MKLNIFFKEDRSEDVKCSLEDIGLNVISSTDDRHVVEASIDEYNLISEIPGIISIEKVGVFDMWKER